MVPNAEFNILDLLLNNADRAFIFLDTNLLIRVINKKASELFTALLSAEPEIGDSIYKFVQPGRQQDLELLYERVLAGHEMYRKFSVTDNNVGEFNFNIHYKPIRDASGIVLGVLILVNDISEFTRAQKLMLQKEQRFRALVQQSTDIIGIINTEAQYEYVSPSTTRILGYLPEELEGGNAFDYIHKDDAEAVADMFSKIADVTRMEIEPYRFLHKNGTWRWIETVATNLLNDPAIRGIVVNSRDVSERIEKDRIIEHSLNEIQNILDYSLDIICTLNEQGMFVKMSKASLVTWGYNSEELIGKHYIDFIHEDDRERTRNAVGEVMSGNPIGNFENRHLTKDGIFIWMSWSANWNAAERRMNCIGKNISDKRKAEEEIRLKEGILNAMIHSMTEGVALTNTKGEVIIYNHALEKILGRPEVHGLQQERANIYQILHPLTRQVVQPEQLPIARALRGETFLNEEFLVNNPTLGLVYIECSGVPVFDSDGVLIGGMTVQRNVSEQRQAAQVIAQSEEKYRSLVEQAYDGIIIADPSLQFIEVNSAALNMFGYAKNEFLQLGFFDLVIIKANETPLNLEHFLLEKVILTTRTARKKNGEEILVEISAVILSNGNFIGFIRDVTERQKAQQALKDSEEKYRQIVETAQEGIWHIDEHNKTVFVNSRMAQMLGYSLEEMQQYSPEHFMAERWKEKFRENKYKRSQGISEQHEFEFVKKNGKPLWGIIESTPLFENNAYKGSLSMIMDITERKVIEDRLLLHERQLSLIYNTVTDVIYMLEVEGSDRYKFVSVNHSFLATTGLTENDIIGKYVHEVIPSPSLQIVLSNYRRAIETSATVTWEETTPYPAGKKTGIVNITPVYDDIGKCVTLVGSVYDITQLRSEQQQLKLFESVVRNTNDVIMITEAHQLDEPGPRIMYVNNAFTKMTGYQRDEVTGRSPRFLQGEKTDKLVLAHLSESLRKNGVGEAELINYKKSGEEFWVSFSVFPILNEKGEYAHLISFERDITERKKQEREREQLIDELTRSNKELKQFSYITSHNLRGPVTNLIAIADLIDISTIHDELARSLIQGFKTATHQLNQTLEDLMKILIIKETHQQSIETVYFKSTADVVTVSLAILIRESGIVVETDFSVVEKVLFNRVYMESIFMNLITNAIKYRDPGRKARLLISSKIEEGRVQLHFKDNGLGFNLEKVKDRVFGLYQRFHANIEGQGFGLYLIHSQIIAMGGTLAVESRLGEGTTFIITFKES